MIDRLFGGLGSADFNSRPFTDIEKAVLRRLLTGYLVLSGSLGEYYPGKAKSEGY